MTRTLIIDDRRTLDESAESVKALGHLTYARNRHEGWTQLSEHGPWDFVLLDHDLGVDLMTGETLDIRPLVSKLCHPALDNMEELHRPTYYSISANPWGRDWVIRMMTDARYHCEGADFPCRLHRFTGARHRL